MDVDQVSWSHPCLFRVDVPCDPMSPIYRLVDKLF